jgi:hypothetical protein
MDSVCEILINVVMLNKPKVLTGLPKRDWSRYRSCSLSYREQKGSRRKGMDLTHSGIGTKHGKPISPPARESDPQGQPMEMWVQERGESEGFSVMEEIGVEPPGNITPRESGQTSTWSPLITRS